MVRYDLLIFHTPLLLLCYLFLLCGCIISLAQLHFFVCIHGVRGWMDVRWSRACKVQTYDLLVLKSLPYKMYIILNIGGNRDHNPSKILIMIYCHDFKTLILNT